MRRRFPATLATGLFVTLVAAAPATVAAQTITGGADRLRHLSIEELLALKVTAVSRKGELWWAAPGAIEVLTSHEIRRSGAQNNEFIAPSGTVKVTWRH